MSSILQTDIKQDQTASVPHDLGAENEQDVSSWDFVAVCAEARDLRRLSKRL